MNGLAPIGRVSSHKCHGAQASEALAYVFTTMLGSLKKTFAWFGTNRKGKFPQVSWCTGIILLRINMQRLTGLKDSEVFASIDVDPGNGLVSPKICFTFGFSDSAANLSE